MLNRKQVIWGHAWCHNVWMYNRQQNWLWIEFGSFGPISLPVHLWPYVTDNLHLWLDSGPQILKRENEWKQRGKKVAIIYVLSHINAIINSVIAQRAALRHTFTSSCKTEAGKDHLKTKRYNCWKTCCHLNSYVVPPADTKLQAGGGRVLQPSY